MKKLALATALALSATLANAAPINTVVSTVGNGFNGSLTRLNDGTFPGEGTAWNSGATVYWNGIGKVFKFAFNDLYRIDGVSLSIDNNDTYALEYSTDDRNWSALFSVGANLGEIGWGMDTMSTVATDPEYIPLIAFSPVQARYVRIAAVQGDNSYAIGEVAFLGTRVEQQPPFPPASVPETGMLALLAAALGAGALTRRRRGN